MNRVKKVLILIAGTTALVLGTVGIFVPGLPTTPLYLLAFWLFSKSSPKLQTMMMNNKITQRYLSKKGVSKAFKIKIILLMMTMVSISAYIYWGKGNLSYFVIALGLIGLPFMIKFIKTTD